MKRPMLHSDKETSKEVLKNLTEKIVATIAITVYQYHLMYWTLALLQAETTG